jgi:hypothetical protein
LWNSNSYEVKESKSNNGAEDAVIILEELTEILINTETVKPQKWTV